MMDITPDFAVLAERWLAESRELTEGVPYTPVQRMWHEGMGQLLKRHGWLTLDGTRATEEGTIATPAEYLSAIRGTTDLQGMREREWELNYCPHCGQEIEDFSTLKKRYVCLICGWHTEGTADGEAYTELCRHVETAHPPESTCPACGWTLIFTEFSCAGEPLWGCENVDCVLVLPGEPGT